MCDSRDSRDACIESQQGLKGGTSTAFAASVPGGDVRETFGFGHGVTWMDLRFLFPYSESEMSAKFFKILY